MLKKLIAMVAIVVAIASCTQSKEQALDTLDMCGRAYISNDTLYYLGTNNISGEELKALETLYYDYVLIIGTDY